MSDKITLEQVHATVKPRDAWWTVLLVDPIAIRLVRHAARHPQVTPNRLTFTAFTVGLGAAGCFAVGTRWWLVAGALLYYVSFVIDCMDGKLARLTGTGSVFGSWLDFIFDRLLVLICAIALMGGQYARTGQVIYIGLAGLVVVLNLFRHVNGQTMAAAQQQMRERLATLQPPDHAPAVPGHDGSFAQLSGEVRARLRSLLRIRAFLAAHRIRADLISGIEFQMAVFVVAALIDQIVVTTVVAAVLLVAFELAMTVQFWLATRAFHQRLAQLRPDRVPVG